MLSAVLSMNEIKKLDDTSTEVIKDMYVTIIKLRKITETLETFLLPEYNEVDYDTLKTNELFKRLLSCLKSRKKAVDF